MIAIISAMPTETDVLLTIFKHYKQVDENPLILQAEIFNKKIYIMQSGIGKCAASLALTCLIERYHPSLIINIGCAGSLDYKVKINDVVLAEKVAIYDYNLPNLEKTFANPEICFKTDSKALGIANNILKNAHIGPMLSGDTFLTEDQYYSLNLSSFKGALCADMEAGALAFVAKRYQIPFLVIRGISDIIIKDENYLDYQQNINTSSFNSALFTYHFLEVYDE